MKKIVFLLVMSALTLMACPQGKACDLEKGAQTTMKAACDKMGEGKACPIKEDMSCTGKEDCKCPECVKTKCSGKSDCQCPKCAQMKCSGKADCACPKCAQKSKPACPHCKI